VCMVELGVDRADAKACSPVEEEELG